MVHEGFAVRSMLVAGLKAEEAWLLGNAGQAGACGMVYQGFAKG